ncbi:MAG TPA: hypothetical protein VEB21_19480 [Terriglobales bacterium]|nr:hypothetical protein [Terriglobales bacterium]
MADSDGKTARVAGTFVLMIGSGLVLDHGRIALGVAVMFVGSVSFLWGLLLLLHEYRSRRSRLAGASVTNTPAPGPGGAESPSADSDREMEDRR